MPRVRELCPVDKRKAVIVYCMAYKDWDNERLERELGIGKKARLERFKEIDRFTMGEIRKIICGVPLSPEQVGTLLGKVQWEVSTLAMQLRSEA